MNTNINPKPNKANGAVMAGAILLLIGSYMLLRQLNLFLLPDYIDLKPLWLIFLGLWIGSRGNYQKSNWVIITGLGVIWLLNSNIPNSDGIVWPAAFIALGLWIIMKKKKTGDHLNDSDFWDKKYQAGTVSGEKPLADFGEAAPYNASTAVPPTDSGTSSGTVPPPSHDDILDATAIFGGVNKTIFSKNFKGGDITNIFGGTEIDFTHADIANRAIIDVTQVFGGTKIIVPANWQVIVDMSAIFAGTDDKRLKSMQAMKSDKVLIIKGVSLFAGLEIRSY